MPDALFVLSKFLQTPPFLWYNKKMQNSFFDTLNTGAAPLAERMRAQVMNEFIGQRHVVGENSLLRRSIRADKLGSCIFWGPPGCGKTTLAHIIANATQCPFEKLNAVSSGVADAKRIIEQAEKHFALTGKSTFLLLDECHRWSKAQSDSVLSAIEKGYIRLIGSTTENPYYSMTPAIVSRCLVFEFRALSEEDIAEGLERALKSPKGLGNLNVELTEGALNQLVRLSGGDLRKAYNGLELAVLTTPRNADGKILIDEKIAAESVQKKPLSVDTQSYYDMISAFIKSMRGSDCDAACFWFNRLIESGCEPMLLARRIVIHASEDVGLADPQALVVAVSAMTAFQNIGLPEGRIPLTQAILYICRAPKSNSVVTALNAAKSAAEKHADAAVPLHLSETYKRASHEEKHEYLYPHDFGGWVKQQYLPDAAKGEKYYFPTGRGQDVEKNPETKN